MEETIAEPASSSTSSPQWSEQRILSASLSNAGCFLHEVGRTTEALRLFQSALEVRMTSFSASTFAWADTFRGEVLGSRVASALREERLLHGMWRQRRRDDGYSRCLDLFQKNDREDTDTNYTTYTRPLHIQKGADFDNLSQTPAASVMALLASKPSRPDSLESATVLYNMALAHHQTGCHEKAIQLFEMALSVHPTMKATRPSLAAAILLNLAQIHYKNGTPQKAMVFLEEALPLEQRASAQSSLWALTSDDAPPTDINLKEAMAMTTSLMGRIQYYHGSRSKSLDLCKETLRLRRSYLPDDHIMVAATLYNIGLVLYQQDKLSEALEHCQFFVKRVVEENERNGAAGYQPQLGSALHTIGVMHLDNGSVSSAVESLKQALRIRRSLHDRANRPRTDLADTLFYLGRIMHEQGDHDAAMGYYVESLQIERETNGDEHEEIATILLNVGQIHHAQGRHDDALTSYEEVLTVARGLFGDGDEFVANMLNMIGAVHQERGESEDAWANFADAERIMDRLASGENAASSQRQGNGGQPNPLEMLVGQTHPHAAAA